VCGSTAISNTYGICDATGFRKKIKIVIRSRALIEITLRVKKEAHYLKGGGHQELVT
jgi:hypothetical protein